MENRKATFHGLVLIGLGLCWSVACNDDADPGGSPAGQGGSAGSGVGGSTATGGSGGSGHATTSGSTNGGTGGTTMTGGSGGNLGDAGAAGEGGAGEGGEAGTGGAPPYQGPACETNTSWPADNCTYPESPGGGEDPEACGVTEGAWYGLGDAELSVWPARAPAHEGTGGLPYRTTELTMASNDQVVALAMDDAVSNDGCRALYRYNGVQWDELTLPDWQAAAPLPGWGLYECAIAEDSMGRWHLAGWLMGEDEYGEERGYLRVWRQDSSGWELLGDVLAETWEMEGDVPSVSIPAFAPDEGGRLQLLYWLENINDTKDEFGQRSWDGAEWVDAALPYPSDPYGYDFYFNIQTFFTANDGQVVTLSHSGESWDFHALSRSGTQWQELGRGGDLDAALLAFGYYPSLVHDDSDAPVLLWATESDLEVVRWSGTKWKHLPATEAVLDTLPPRARFDVRAIDGAVRVRYFQDCSWHGLSGSDKGGGVSNGTSAASDPVFVLQSDSICVAWAESSANEWRSFVRCHDLPE